MKTLALLLAICLTACASNDAFISENEVETCQPGSDIELQAGTAEGNILPDGRAVVLVEVANNSDHDFTVQTVRVDALPQTADRTRYEVLGGTRNFDREVPEAEDALFEVPITVRMRETLDNVNRQQSITVVQVAVTVKLTDGNSARCHFALPLRF
jgi:hypothetical protein